MIWFPCSLDVDIIIDNTIETLLLFWMEQPWLKLFWVDPPLMLPPLNPPLCSPALIMTDSCCLAEESLMTVILLDLSGLIGQPFKQERIYGGGFNCHKRVLVECQLYRPHGGVDPGQSRGRSLQ